jgi:hypothetical protein
LLSRSTPCGVGGQVRHRRGAVRRRLNSLTILHMTGLFCSTSATSLLRRGIGQRRRSVVARARSSWRRSRTPARRAGTVLFDGSRGCRHPGASAACGTTGCFEFGPLDIRDERASTRSLLRHAPTSH